MLVVVDVDDVDAAEIVGKRLLVGLLFGFVEIEALRGVVEALFLRNIFCPFDTQLFDEF